MKSVTTLKSETALKSRNAFNSRNAFKSETVLKRGNALKSENALEYETILKNKNALKNRNALKHENFNSENTFKSELANDSMLLYIESQDEQLVEFARSGDMNALEFIINKYRRLVKAKARTYFLIGADREDIVQEGMIGLFKAVRDYNEDKQSNFRAFAELCITRQIITAIKMATRQKHIPLNSYVSLNKPVNEEDSGHTLSDIICFNEITDPEELIINSENFTGIEERLTEVLSELEWKVLKLYLQGVSCQEISKSLKRDNKSIDNAMQRVKRKLEKTLYENSNNVI